MEPKLQEETLPVTKRDAQLDFYFVPNFSTLSQDNLNYHVAKKHNVSRPSMRHKCKLRHAEFRGFYALRQHKNTENGPQKGFGASNIDVEDSVGDVDDQGLREELESCKQFLTNTEMDNEDTDSSTSPCHPSTLVCSTINWIMYSRN